MYSMMWAEMEYVGSDVRELSEPLMEHIVVARRSLSLFQGCNSIEKKTFVSKPKTKFIPFHHLIISSCTMIGSWVGSLQDLFPGMAQVKWQRSNKQLQVWGGTGN